MDFMVAHPHSFGRLPLQWKCWFLRRRVNRNTRRKPLPLVARERTKWQQTQLTYGVDTGTWTRATLVGGGRTHHCATLAPSIWTVNRLRDLSFARRKSVSDCDEWFSSKRETTRRLNCTEHWDKLWIKAIDRERCRYLFSGTQLSTQKMLRHAFLLSAIFKSKNWPTSWKWIGFS